MFAIPENNPSSSQVPGKLTIWPPTLLDSQDSIGINDKPLTFDSSKSRTFFLLSNLFEAIRKPLEN